jgi:CheY-like chemotaxis protein
MEGKSEYKNLQNKRILLAEDVKLNQWLAQKLLESWGCEVILANNGKEALSMILTHEVDCILMDVQMPELDGVAATEQIRKLADRHKANIPIIALTANTLSEDLEKYLKAGMNDCIPKPVYDEKLYKALEKNLLTNRESTENEKIMQLANEASGKVYDLSMVISVSGGSREFIKKMVLLFIDTVPVNVQDLKKFAADKNWEQTAKIAHKLKSTIDSMGIRSLHQCIREIETDAKQKTELFSIPGKIELVEAVIGQCVFQLREEMAESND